MIQVVDSICGSGKSTAIFKVMQEQFKKDSTKKFLYITPFLTEIEERVPNELPEMNFLSPKNVGKGKLDTFESLVDRGCNISATHKLFSMFTPDIVKKLIDKQYTLVIDEAIDCVGLLPSSFKPSDTDALLNGDFVIADKENRGQLIWNEDKYPNHDGKYSLIRDMCSLQMMYCFEDKFLMWEYPPELLRGLNDVYVLTYLFNGSDMRCWLELNGIDYSYVDNSSFGIRPEQEIKDELKCKLKLISNRSLDSIQQRKTTLSKGWFEKANTTQIDKFKKVMRSTVVKEKVKSNEVFWTTFKDHANKLAGDGYRKGVREKDKDKEGISFLPCNLRATNKYQDYHLCMYGMNIFKNPVETRYMKSNSIEVDEDIYALSEMIQFIFRGCIRKGDEMKLLVLSKRMRELLEDWLYLI